MSAIAVAPSDILRALLFVWNYRLLPDSWFLGHTWSLSVEEQFYLLWPALMAWAGTGRSSRVALVLIALLPAVRRATHLFCPGIRGYVPVMGHTRADSLMFGLPLAATVHDTAEHDLDRPVSAEHRVRADRG